MQTVQDVIEQQVTIAGSRGQVWAALTDAHQLRAWFAAGECDVDLRVGGLIQFTWHEGSSRATIVALDKPRRFAWTWVPGNLERIDEPLDGRPTTHVEFTLEDAGDGQTLVTCHESGFAALSDADRERAYPMNVAGWEECLASLREHVER